MNRYCFGLFNSFAQKINMANPDCSGFLGFDADLLYPVLKPIATEALLIHYLRVYAHRISPMGFISFLAFYAQFKLLGFHEINVIADLF